MSNWRMLSSPRLPSTMRSQHAFNVPSPQQSRFGNGTSRFRAEPSFGSRGLCSVLVSDEHDTKNKIVVGAAQVNRTSRGWR